jgi:hypothetical protein
MRPLILIQKCQRKTRRTRAGNISATDEADTLHVANFMARPEGFEPPTFRSEVLSNPQQHVLTRNRSRVFQAFSIFHFMSVRLSSSHCGNKFGNKQGRESRESTSCYSVITSTGALVGCNLEITSKKAIYPQILSLSAVKSPCFSTPCPVSTMFPC